MHGVYTHEIKRVWQVRGVWLARVLIYAPCGCSSRPLILQFKQAERPNEKEIENEINNQR